MATKPNPFEKPAQPATKTAGAKGKPTTPMPFGKMPAKKAASPAKKG